MPGALTIHMIFSITVCSAIV